MNKKEKNSKLEPFSILLSGELSSADIFSYHAPFFELLNSVINGEQELTIDEITLLVKIINVLFPDLSILSSDKLGTFILILSYCFKVIRNDSTSKKLPLLPQNRSHLPRITTPQQVSIIRPTALKQPNSQKSIRTSVSVTLKHTPALNSSSSNEKLLFIIFFLFFQSLYYFNQNLISQTQVSLDQNINQDIQPSESDSLSEPSHKIESIQTTQTSKTTNLNQSSSLYHQFSQEEWTDIFHLLFDSISHTNLPIPYILFASACFSLLISIPDLISFFFTFNFSSIFHLFNFDSRDSISAQFIEYCTYILAVASKFENMSTYIDVKMACSTLLHPSRYILLCRGSSSPSRRVSRWARRAWR